MYRIDAETDTTRVSEALIPYGIYIEHDLLGNIYLMVALNVFKHCSPPAESIGHKYRRRKKTQ